MNQRKFNLWHKISACTAFLVSAITYLLTIEPSASFWDCGEFIASSYKLEVGHPPGNPVFQLIARVFTMFGDNMHAAVLVNAMSAICSALTIFFLYLTIVWLAKRILKPGENGEYSTADAIAVIGSGLTGSLIYCFSDTFWFSAVEGEVYAMSSLFTAAVFWLMTIWYDRADEARSYRWIVLIAFLMGLSIGVHLLNLLAIPALVFMFYYRNREDKPFTFKELLKIFCVGVIILAVILFAIVPWLPKMAAYVDLVFVNLFHLPYNTGAAFFLLGVLALCIWGIYRTMLNQKVFWNTALLCLTTIIIGFSVFSIDIIRSCAKTPTNEYQPDNAFTLVRYLSREQYGKSPLLYGQYFDAPYDLKTTKYWAPLDGKYKKVDGPVDAEYKPAGKMLFPRMWSSAGDGKYENFYKSYTGGKGQKVAGAKYRKPTAGANLLYFFDYQLNWMYWRYFAWNFIGRQNDIHSPAPGNIFYGNWESGIGFIDNIHLGDQSQAPAILAENKGKNHYYFLPLLLGLLGLFFQYEKDKRGCWITFLMFFMTGIAIVIYLNQPPYQVRERDYAYAGSFYFFSAWTGLAVASIAKWLHRITKQRANVLCSSAVTVLCLGVPALMASQNWDDHDRSNRRTAVELARNYLESVGKNGLLVTHGDNDTFPLWYAQEVENVRTDVRICNTSLLGTDWHIDQMLWASNESSPLNLRIPHKMYLYGTNEYIPINDSKGQVESISDVISAFISPSKKIKLTSGRKVSYIESRKISVPVNRENVIKYGILDKKFYDLIPDEIVLTISPGKDFLSKPELFILDFLSTYEWDRPLNLLNMGGDLNVGIKEYLMYDGYSYRFVPIRNTPSTLDAGIADVDDLYRKMTSVFKFDALSRDDYFIDYQNLYTHLGVMSVRTLFLTSAKAFIKAGRLPWAIEMLDKSMEVTKNYPIEAIPLGFTGNDYVVISIAETYYKLGQRDKANRIVQDMAEQLLKSARFYLQYYEYAKDDFEMCGSYIFHLSDIMEKHGDKTIAKALKTTFNEMLSLVGGAEGNN